MEHIQFEIQREMLYEIIANKLEEMILNDTIQVDQKLPSEQTLAVSFGVSRPVIREALKILKERGLITQRQGASPVICEPGADVLTRTVSRIVQIKDIDPMHVYQVRLNLEMMSIQLACENATGEDIDRLSGINRKMEEFKDNLEKRIAYDIEFHSAIAHSSGNPLLEIFIEAISAELLRAMIASALTLENASEDGIIYHDKIIDVIRSRDSEKAADLIRMHLMSSFRNFEASNKN